MATTSAIPGATTYESGYETGSIGVPIGTDTLQSSVVNDPTLAPVNPNVDTPTSGAIRTAPILNQQVAPNQLAVPTINDPAARRANQLAVNCALACGRAWSGDLDRSGGNICFQRGRQSVFKFVRARTRSGLQ